MKTFFLATILSSFLAFLLVSFLAGSANAATVSWQDNSDNETTFKIYRATTAISQFVEVGSVGANVITFVDPAGAPGNCWRVPAANSAGESHPSNVACLPQPVIIIPLSPTGTAVLP